jgi:hypothetical protein
MIAGIVKARAGALSPAAPRQNQTVQKLQLQNRHRVTKTSYARTWPVRLNHQNCVDLHILRTERLWHLDCGPDVPIRGTAEGPVPGGICSLRLLW